MTQFAKIKADPEKYALEKERVKKLLNDRYKTDPDFRKLCVIRNREYRNKQKLFKNNLDNNKCQGCQINTLNHQEVLNVIKSDI
jgi:hypothetical protein